MAHTGDVATVRARWPSLKRAIAWMITVRPIVWRSQELLLGHLLLPFRAMLPVKIVTEHALRLCHCMNDPECRTCPQYDGQVRLAAACDNDIRSLPVRETAGPSTQSSRLPWGRLLTQNKNLTALDITQLLSSPCFWAAGRCVQRSYLPGVAEGRSVAREGCRRRRH